MTKSIVLFWNFDSDRRRRLVCTCKKQLLYTRSKRYQIQEKKSTQAATLFVIVFFLSKSSLLLQCLLQITLIRSETTCYDEYNYVCEKIARAARKAACQTAVDFEQRKARAFWEVGSSEKTPFGNNASENSIHQWLLLPSIIRRCFVHLFLPFGRRWKQRGGADWSRFDWRREQKSWGDDDLRNWATFC